MAELESDVRNLLKDISALERQVYNLRLTQQGDDGRGGIVKTLFDLGAQLSSLTLQVTKIAIQQETDARILRLAIWMPTIIALVSLSVSLIAIWQAAR